MVLFSKAVIALAATFLTSAVFAHPGHDVTEEVAQRAAYFAKTEKRSLAHCAAKLKERGVHDRSVARRKQMLENLRKKRSLESRDFNAALNTTHHSTHNYTLNTPSDVIFAGNKSCILTPEVTEGPYYVTGEYVRQNVTEAQVGVPLTYEMQVINVNTCEPVTGVMLEMWSCNSTGVYGGIAGGNANGVVDQTNLNNTMLRGIQASKQDGTVVFDTVVPGHYIGRTPHIHVMAHFNASVLPNNTISGGTVSHVGQIFFDQDLITAVEQTHPYVTNTQPFTKNSEDFIMAQEAQNGDPILEYTLLGSEVSHGLFGWMTFGVDPTANHTVFAAASYGQGGGKTNPGGPGGPGGFPGGPFPSGGFPPFPSGGFPGFPSGLPSGFSFPNFPMPTNFPRPSVSGGMAPGPATTTAA